MFNNFGYTQQARQANEGPNASYGSYGYGGGGYGTYAQPQPYMMPSFTTQQVPPASTYVTPSGGTVAAPAFEESYVENILRLNRGKLATFYMTYENNSEWNAKIFKGIIEAAGRDHIIISDPSTGMRYLLLMLNLDYVTFDEPINYEYPFQGTVVTPSTPMQ